MASHIRSEYVNQEVAEAIHNQMLFGIAGAGSDHTKDTRPTDNSGKIANLGLDIRDYRQRDIPCLSISLFGGEVGAYNSKWAGNTPVNGAFWTSREQKPFTANIHK